MPITLGQRLTLWFRKTPVGPLEEAWRVVEAEQLPVSLDALEAHLLSGGSPVRVVKAMVLEQRRSARDFVALTAVDLALVHSTPALEGASGHPPGVASDDAREGRSGALSITVLVGVMAVSLLTFALFDIRPIRVAMVLVGGLFLAASVQRPRWAWRAVRHEDWFALLPAVVLRPLLALFAALALYLAAAL